MQLESLTPAKVSIGEIKYLVKGFSALTFNSMDNPNHEHEILVRAS